MSVDEGSKSQSEDDPVDNVELKCPRLPASRNCLGRMHVEFACYSYTYVPVRRTAAHAWLARAPSASRQDRRRGLCACQFARSMTGLSPQCSVRRRVYMLAQNTLSNSTHPGVPCTAQAAGTVITTTSVRTTDLHAVKLTMPWPKGGQKSGSSQVKESGSPRCQRATKLFNPHNVDQARALVTSSRRAYAWSCWPFAT